MPEDEDEEDIFNTEYVDVITNGDLKFAYVPDSPEAETAADDPFDTSVVEKLVGPLPVIKKKKALVSIGAAVEILTAANAAEQLQKQHQASANSRQRIVQPPTEIQLLCCFDDDSNDPKEEQKSGNSLAVTPSVNRSSAPSSSHPTPKTETHPEEQLVSDTPDLKDILAEFDVIADSEPVVEELIEPPPPTAAPAPASAAAEPNNKKPELNDEEDFEFEALAYESLAKHPQPLLPEEEEGDDPFDTSAVEKVLKDPVQVESKKPPPTRPGAPPARQRPPPPSASAIASIAAKIDRPTPAGPPAAVAPAPASNPPLVQAQDSFDALFLDDSPTDKEPIKEVALLQKPQENPLPPIQEPPVEASPLHCDDIDPFDTSAVDPFDTSAVSDPFDTTTATKVINSSSALPSDTPVTSFAVIDDSPLAEEVDPFDTSAVEKILN